MQHEMGHVLGLAGEPLIGSMFAHGLGNDVCSTVRSTASRLMVPAESFGSQL
jgi:hypothetical protein